MFIMTKSINERQLESKALRAPLELGFAVQGEVPEGRVLTLRQPLSAKKGALKPCEAHAQLLLHLLFARLQHAVELVHMDELGRATDLVGHPENKA